MLKHVYQIRLNYPLKSGPLENRPAKMSSFNFSGFQMLGIWIPTAATLFTHKLKQFFFNTMTCIFQAFSDPKPSGSGTKRKADDAKPGPSTSKPKALW